MLDGEASGSAVGFVAVLDLIQLLAESGVGGRWRERGVDEETKGFLASEWGGERRGEGGGGP